MLGLTWTDLQSDCNEVIRVQPENTTVEEGQTAYFDCECVRLRIPLWNITTATSSRLYTSGYLPPKFEYNGTGLLVYQTDLTMNSTRIACRIFIQETEVCKSTTGTLTVVAKAETTDSALSNNNTVKTIHINLVCFVYILFVNILLKAAW